MSDELEQGRAGDPADSLDPWWDDQRPVRVSPMPVLHLNGFDGPLDLLLDLADRQRIDLGRMSMADLAEQFVAEAERLVGTVPLEQRAAWLVLATRLLLLRTRLLLPNSPAEAQGAERDAAAELRRLDTLAAIRAAAAWLGDRDQLGQDVFARAPLARPAPHGGYVALMEACLVVLQGRAGRAEDDVGRDGAVYRPSPPDLWRVPDALARIQAVLAEHLDGGTLELFLPTLASDEPQRALKARAAVASTLVAGLELVRTGQVNAEQDEAFGSVHLQAVSAGAG